MIDMFRTTLQVLHVVARPLLQVLGQKMYMYLGGFKLSSIRNDGTKNHVNMVTTHTQYAESHVITHTVC